MSTKKNEIEALAEIDGLLEHLKDEERQRIFDYITSKYKLVINNQSSSGPGSQTSQNNIGSKSNTVVGDIKSFIIAKKPDSTYERITCLVYYLEKVDKMDGVKNTDIVSAVKNARLSPLSNSTVFINHAVSRYKFLTPLGGGKKGLSARGEALVDALPSRENVAAALAEHPIGKISKSKKKKSKKSK
jgi:hypothetical protein